MTQGKVQIKLVTAPMKPEGKARLNKLFRSTFYQTVKAMLGLRYEGTGIYPFASDWDAEPLESHHSAIFQITRSVPCSGIYDTIPLGPCALRYRAGQYNTWQHDARGTRVVQTRSIEIECTHNRGGLVCPPMGAWQIGGGFWRIHNWHGGEIKVEGPAWPVLGHPVEGFPVAPSREDFDAADHVDLGDLEPGAEVVMLTGAGRHAVVTVAKVEQPGVAPYMSERDVAVRWLTRPYSPETMRPTLGRMPRNWKVWVRNA